MEILPAIDLKNGKCVRLERGEAALETIYETNALKVAKSFEDAGAKWLHVVDLDGAFSGSRTHAKIIEEIIKNTNLNIELGGGLRNLDDIKACIDSGISRVILGTIAYENPDIVSKAIELFGEKIAVGLDCRNGKIAIRGWKLQTELTAENFADDMVKRGVKTIIYTDIATDGMLSGPNYSALENLLSKIDADIIASGGIANLEHVNSLKQLKPRAPWGCIIGKAIYAETIKLHELFSNS